MGFFFRCVCEREREGGGGVLVGGIRALVLETFENRGIFKIGMSYWRRRGADDIIFLNITAKTGHRISG